MINTPNFWKEKNLISLLLSPLSIIYFIGFKVYEFFSKEVDIGVPVICVGNLVAGGSGKTPKKMVQILSLWTMVYKVKILKKISRY